MFNILEENVYITDLAIKYQQNKEKKKYKDKTQQCILKKKWRWNCETHKNFKVKWGMGYSRTNYLTKNYKENVTYWGF